MINLVYLLLCSPALCRGRPLQEKCAQYWPSDGAVAYGDVSIEIKREDESESYTVRELLVTNNRVRALCVSLYRHHSVPPLDILDILL